MKLSSLTLILQAAIKTVLGVSLVLLGFGVSGAVTGILVSFGLAPLWLLFCVFIVF
jgi:hypothetical protein